MKKMIYALVLVVLLFVPARSAYARTDGTLDGQVVIGQDFTLKSGETLDGDLVVIGGTATIEGGATVAGDVVVIGGSLKLDGRVTHDAVVIGGVASMGAQSSLSGDMVTMGGVLKRAEGAMIAGNVVSNYPAPTLPIPNSPSQAKPAVPPIPKFDSILTPISAGANILFLAFILGALAVFLTLFMQPQLERVGQAIVTQPFMVGSFGVLTFILTIIAVPILALTIILAPVAIVVGMLLFTAWLFGMIALGVAFGERFTKALHQNWTPMLSAGLGTFLLMILLGGLNLVPCLGLIAEILVGLVGIGAVTVTIFGTRPLLNSGILSVTAPPKDAGQGLPT